MPFTWRMPIGGEYAAEAGIAQGLDRASSAIGAAIVSRAQDQQRRKEAAERAKVEQERYDRLFRLKVLESMPGLAKDVVGSDLGVPPVQTVPEASAALSSAAMAQARGGAGVGPEGVVERFNPASAGEDADAMLRGGPPASVPLARPPPLPPAVSARIAGANIVPGAQAQAPGVVAGQQGAYQQAAIEKMTARLGAAGLDQYITPEALASFASPPKGPSVLDQARAKAIRQGRTATGGRPAQSPQDQAKLILLRGVVAGLEGERRTRITKATILARLAAARFNDYDQERPGVAEAMDDVSALLPDGVLTLPDAAKILDVEDFAAAERAGAKVGGGKKVPALKPKTSSTGGPSADFFQ